MNNSGPKVDSWGTPLCNVFQLEENFPFLFCGYILTFCFLVVRYVLNQWALAAQIP
jgi:hypothetical protein